MSKELLEKVVNQGVDGNLNSFFCDVSNSYVELWDDLTAYDDERFAGFRAIGEIVFNPNEKLVVVTARVLGSLSERSGKKAQYEKAKKILKDFMKYDAGIFVFSDAVGSFRFSLVYGQAQGTKRVFSNFRRFTYFVSRDQTNKTFYDRIGRCDFSSLDIIKDAFSVEKVNKEFYQQIARYYYRLTGKDDCKKELVLPSVGEGDERKYEEFAIRLIGRIIFCWFLRHKKSGDGVPLMPDEVLSLKAVQDQSDYYHFMLEPLFFEVMNKPINERKQITIPKSGVIPFLNGGLFEPHTNDYYQNMANYGLKIPDHWFIDFFSVLEQYNFTIDENSTVDAEVSVDPEMLGRIFENLLAEVVPETGETARKATGSYYTPRAIVDYMVEQSLKQYLLTKTSLPEDKLDSLLSYEDSEIDLSDAERNAVVTALKEIKVIDPACGSGAFPMGILHRMLLVLERVDHRLEIWRQQYLDALDSIVRQVVMKNIRRENWVYIRKLMIIRDSIYGVDIQPLAVEIAKLRCFLSLVVDEIVLDNEENRGIEPLPNLEFKFVAANTLIDLPKAASQSAFGVTETIKMLKKLRESYLNSFGADKLRIEKEFKSTQQKLFKENVQWAVADTLVKQLTEWDPFSYESCGWFDPGWMFGESGGFDVVIANPPYGFRDVLSKNEKGFFRKEKGIQFPSGDAAELFIIITLEKLVKEKGSLTFIIPKKSLYGESWRNVRKIWTSHGLTYLMDASKAFEKVLLEQVSFSIIKGNPIEKVAIGTLNQAEDRIAIFGSFLVEDIFTENLKNAQIYRGVFPNTLLGKLKSRSVVPTDGLVRGEIGISNITPYLTFEADGNYPCVKGIDIINYGLKPERRYLKGRIAKKYLELYQDDKIVAQKIIAHVQNPLPHIIITMFYDTDKRLINDTCVEIKTLNDKLDKKFLLAYYQSTFCNWYAYNLIYNRATRTMDFIDYYITQIPIPKCVLGNPTLQKPIIILVDQILDITKDEDYLSNRTKQDRVKEYQCQIDQMVYELYGLTPEEIGVVEGTFKK